MWRRVREIILQDVNNENEIKMYAVILRMNLLAMLVYYVIVLGSALVAGRQGAGIVAALGAALCVGLFYDTYQNKTRFVAFTFNVSITLLVLLYALMYGNQTYIYNFLYVQIVLLYAVDYLSAKKKAACVALLVAFRLWLFYHTEKSGVVYAIGVHESTFLQVLHIITTCTMLVTIVSISTQDFREMQEKLVSYNQKLRNIAGNDPLTGLRNRRSAMEYIGGKVRKYQAGDCSALTIAIGDIDFFKRINDTYGHNYGDVVLKTLADLFRSFMEGKGQAARWGGEEFLFIFYNINGDEASCMLSELRQLIHRMEFRLGSDLIKITMTFGVAEHELRNNADITINEADQKLYTRKEKGRDIIIY